MRPLRIIRAERDLLFDEAGRRYIDLFSAHGTAWLGHADPRIGAAIADQLGRVWITGGLETPASLEARQRIESFFPTSHRLAALYSTGMEAAEFALRFARVTTGRAGAVGFERGMHGKSLATAALGWDNGEGVSVPSVHRLPFPSAGDEDRALERLEGVLSERSIAAVFLEPLQGCGGGHEVTPRFAAEARALCSRFETLLVFDEILTGFYRTGPAFLFSSWRVTPDLVLIGKALGNGFPVSAVIADQRYPVRAAMLPGSTFAGNPLAAAAVAATLQRLAQLDLPAAVAAIERTVLERLASVRAAGVPVRGRGAFWVIELPATIDIEQLVVRIYQRGVAVGFAGRHLRLLPAAVIDPSHLAEGCAVIAEEVARAVDG